LYGNVGGREEVEAVKECAGTIEAACRCVGWAELFGGGFGDQVGGRRLGQDAWRRGREAVKKCAGAIEAACRCVGRARLFGGRCCRDQ
jgi:hypothetical protein